MSVASYAEYDSEAGEECIDSRKLSNVATKHFSASTSVAPERLPPKNVDGVNDTFRLSGVTLVDGRFHRWEQSDVAKQTSQTAEVSSLTIAELEDKLTSQPKPQSQPYEGKPATGYEVPQNEEMSNRLHNEHVTLFQADPSQIHDSSMWAAHSATDSTTQSLEESEANEDKVGSEDGDEIKDSPPLVLATEQVSSQPTINLSRWSTNKSGIFNISRDDDVDKDVRPRAITQATGERRILPTTTSKMEPITAGNRKNKIGNIRSELAMMRRLSPLPDLRKPRKAETRVGEVPQRAPTNTKKFKKKVIQCDDVNCGDERCRNRRPQKTTSKQEEWAEEEDDSDSDSLAGMMNITDILPAKQPEKYSTRPTMRLPSMSAREYRPVETRGNDQAFVPYSASSFNPFSRSNRESYPSYGSYGSYSDDYKPHYGRPYYPYRPPYPPASPSRFGLPPTMTPESLPCAHLPDPAHKLISDFIKAQEKRQTEQDIALETKEQQKEKGEVDTAILVAREDRSDRLQALIIEHVEASLERQRKWEEDRAFAEVEKAAKEAAVEAKRAYEDHLQQEEARRSSMINGLQDQLNLIKELLETKSMQQTESSSVSSLTEPTPQQLSAPIVQRREDGWSRCTYRHVAVLLLTHQSVAKQLVQLAKIYPPALEGAFAIELGLILKEYLTRLNESIASETERHIHHALHHALFKPSREPLLKMAHLISSLPEHLRIRICKGLNDSKELITIVDGIPDGDVNARQLDKAWLKCFESQQAQAYLFLGGPGQRLELDLLDLAIPKSFESTALMATAQRCVNGSANTDLLHVAKDLAQATPESVKITFSSNSRKCGPGWMNRVQTAVENLTDTQWNWWPLMAPQQGCDGNNDRVAWTCACGEQRSAVVPLEFATELFRSMHFRPVVLEEDLPDASQPPAISLSREPSGTGEQSQSHTSLVEFDVREADGNSIPCDGFPSSRSAMELTDLERGNLGYPVHATHNRSTSSQSVSTSISAGETLVGSQYEVEDFMQRYIFFALRQGQDYHLSQIAVYNVGDDGFFKALKREYRTGKGWIRRLLSVWKFAHCEFTMFEKIAEHEITPRPEGPPLPPDAKKEYSFTPRPAEVLPPISKHEFNWRFYSNRRTGTHSWSKACRTTKGVIQRIPKRDIEVMEQGDVRDLFWGLLAVDEISFLTVAIYHVMLLLPSLMFWVYWMSTGHAADLQNASVPFLAGLGCLSLFWFPLMQR